MTMKKSLLLVLGLTASAVALQVQADGDANAGSSKATVCFACHGPNGNSASGQFPKLAGQDMQDLAAYFASQTVATGEAAAGQVKQGESLFRNGNVATNVPACEA